MSAAKITLIKIDEASFLASDGRVMKRENGETPNGNPLGGRWVLRSPQGEFIDFDQYLHDLAERNDLRFEY
jgi:hypothetical protein